MKFRRSWLLVLLFCLLLASVSYALSPSNHLGLGEQLPLSKIIEDSVEPGTLHSTGSSRHSGTQVGLYQTDAIWRLTGGDAVSQRLCHEIMTRIPARLRELGAEDVEVESLTDMTWRDFSHPRLQTHGGRVSYRHRGAHGIILFRFATVDDATAAPSQNGFLTAQHYEWR